MAHRIWLPSHLPSIPTPHQITSRQAVHFSAQYARKLSKKVSRPRHAERVNVSNPFIIEISRNRHIQYCQKRGKRQYSRGKACSACNKAKLKCNFRHPCQRCTAKGYACVYEALPRTGYASGRKSNTSRVDHAANVSTSLPTAVEMLESQMDGQSSSTQDHSTISEILDIDDFVPQDTQDIVAYTIPQAATNIDPQLFQESESCTESAYNTSQNTDPLTTSTSLGKPSAVPLSLIALIASILRTYPKMLLRRSTLPPYIHPVSYKPDEDDYGPFPEPLEVCISIGHMFAARTEQTSKFLWRTIDNEMERFLKEVCTYSCSP